MHEPQAQQRPRHRHISLHGVYTLVVLCYVNMLNYADRYGVFAVLEFVRQHYDVDENIMLMLPITFVFCYMLAGLLFGYLGERGSRYVLMLVAVGVWCAGALLGTFLIYDYWLFVLSRLLVALGEAGYTALASSVLADTVSGARRSVALAFFYASIPVGASVGYVACAKLMQRSGQWWYGMRVTALLGTLSLVGLSTIEVPPQGEREAIALGHQPTGAKSVVWDDFIFLLTNATYVASTLALTTIGYVVGVLAWWLPQYMYDVLQLIEPEGPAQQQQRRQLTQLDVGVCLALMLAASGVGGALIGALVSLCLRPRFPNVDSIVCSVCSLLTALLLGATVLISNENETALYCLVFFSLLALNTIWSVAGDILLYVVVHTNRCVAAALQMLVVHGLGGLIGPYVVAITYERCLVDCGFPPGTREYHALRVSLMTTFLAAVVGAALYLVATYFMANDRDVALKVLLST